MADWRIAHTHNESGINSVSDLKGKKLGIAGGPVENKGLNWNGEWYWKMFDE